MCEGFTWGMGRGDGLRLEYVNSGVEIDPGNGVEGRV